MRAASSSLSPILRLSITSLKYVRSVSKIPAISEPKIPEKPTSELLPHLPEDPNRKTDFPEKIRPYFSFTGNPSSPSAGYSQDSIATSEIPQETTLHSDNDVMDALLSRVDDPQSALEWVQKQHGFTRGVEVYCVLIYILMRSPETLGHARKLINEYISACSCPSPAVVVDRLINCAERFDFLRKDEVFEYLLDCYITSDRIEHAIECFDSMIRGDVIPRVPCMNKFFGALLRREMIDELRDFNDRMVKKGVYGNHVTVRVMCRALLKEGKVEEVEEYFRESKRRGVELDAGVYDIVIQAVCRKQGSTLGIGLLEEMKERAWVPSEATFTRVIDVCAEEGNMVEALRLKDEMISCGKPMNLLVASILMKGHFAQGNSDGALNLYDKIIEDGLVPNRLTYSVLISGCCQCGNVEKASELYTQMKLNGILPSELNVVNLLRGYLKASLREEASKLFDEAVDCGLANSFTYGVMISQLHREDKMDEACSLWDSMINRGIAPGLTTYNSMLIGHCTKGNMDMASGLFSDMLERGLKPNAFTYSILIDGHFQKGDRAKALDLFDEMKSSGIAPTDFTYGTIIYGLCREGKMDEACRLWDSMINRGIAPHLFTYNFMITGHCRKGNMDMASSVFSDMLERGLKPNARTYSILMLGHFQKGDRAKALDLFDEMKSSGIAPTDVTYNTIIEGLCSVGCTSEARDTMKKFLETGFSPSTITLNSIVGGFLKEGEINSALGVYKEMCEFGASPDVVTYASLICGLCISDNIDLALKMWDEMKDKGLELKYKAAIDRFFQEGGE